MMALNPTLPAEETRPGVWRRWCVEPVLAQLRQGITPDKLALTMAVGAMAGTFPVLGSTTILCLSLGALLRLNQPILQAVNHACYPLQLILIPVFIRLGERIYHAPPLPFSIPQLLGKFRSAPLPFFREFSSTFGHCITAWALFAPIAGGLIYRSMRPLLRAAANKPRPS